MCAGPNAPPPSTNMPRVSSAGSQLTSQTSFSTLPAATTTSTPDKKNKKEKKKLFGKKKKEEEHILEISGPTGFKHESHIGWDAQQGFEVPISLLALTI